MNAAAWATMAAVHKMRVNILSSGSLWCRTATRRSIFQLENPHRLLYQLTLQSPLVANEIWFGFGCMVPGLYDVLYTLPLSRRLGTAERVRCWAAGSRRPAKRPYHWRC
jgi:hypothetical protein